MLADAVVSANRHAPQHECLFQPGQLARIQDRVAEVAVAESVQDYLVRLAEASRQHPEIVLGLSPRGLLTWQRMAQAWAYLDGRSFITPNDVQDVALPVLIVRLGIERDDTRPVIEELLNRVEVPTGA
jgi:MoxR-like ATPase